MRSLGTRSAATSTLAASRAFRILARRFGVAPLARCCSNSFPHKIQMICDTFEIWLGKSPVSFFYSEVHSSMPLHFASATYCSYTFFNFSIFLFKGDFWAQQYAPVDGRRIVPHDGPCRFPYELTLKIIETVMSKKDFG